MRGAIDFTPGRNSQRGAWLGDFRYEDGRILVKSTGVWIKNDFQLWSDIIRWLSYYAFVRWRGFWAARGARIYFTPHRPRPWYIVWAAAVWGGMRFANSAAEADASFYFEDRTQASPPAAPSRPAFNFGVADVSKTHVARVMEAVFGYPLAVDPTAFIGEAVEKGEGNGLHDGRLVLCPLSPAPDKAYQRVIKTEGEDGWAYDLRTACVGRKPILVFLKKKPATARFSIQNTSVLVKRPAEVFSPTDIVLIERFCEAMELDWGGLDVLREHETGRLYIVDVNKTDTGPAVVLNWRDRALATRLLSEALRAAITAS